LIEELDRLATDSGYPVALRCDDGPDVAYTAMADWAGERVGQAFLPPGSRGGAATSNRSTAGSASWLNLHLFWPFAHARVVISDWKTECNDLRWHSALG
jgi:hypothetical protein